MKPGDRVGFQIRDGHWIPGSILHLERAPDGEPVAWLLTGAPGLQVVDTVPARSIMRLRRPDQPRLLIG